MAWRVPVPVVLGVLLNRHRVFMLRRSRTPPLPNRWELPGGKVELGEEPEAALRRELKEELGLKVGRLVLFRSYSHVYDLPDGPVHYVLVAYRGHAREGPWSKPGRWMDAEALEAAHVIEGSRALVSDLVEERLVRPARRLTGLRVRPRGP